MNKFTPFRYEKIDPNLNYETITKVDNKTWKVNIISKDLYSVNIFRRILTSQIPSLAIHNIIINTNTSCMISELIFSIIDSIPLKCEYEIYDLWNNMSDIDDDIFGKSYINVECPYDSLRPKSITSSDIMFDNINIEVIDKDIHIGYLQPGQSISLYTDITMGSASIHTFDKENLVDAKWNPVIVCNIHKNDEKNNNYIIELELLGSVNINNILKIGLSMYKKYIFKLYS